jgi:hypothetical protein
MRRRPPADALLTVALGMLTFLFACKELFDADLWWHLRAGRWILEHRSVPRTDPFTFGSAGQPWIDLHWIFQMALALAYAAGGVAGTILLAAAGATTAVVWGFSLRDRQWPAAMVAAAWIPGVLLASTRFDPRPEIVTLICLSAFFGILLRARAAPSWLWLLVPIQVLWVNTHGLFVLGPWILALFLVDRAIAGGEASWRQLMLPSLAVCLSCVANPYGLRGVLLPLELFPKLTEGGGLYKSYIGEFMSARSFVAGYWMPVPGHDIYLRLFVFLLCALPKVFIVTSLERAWRSAFPSDDEAPDRPGLRAGVMAFAMGVAVVVAMGLPGSATPKWLIATGRAIPWVMVGVGGSAAVALGRRSQRVAALAVLGAGATAGWITWLVSHLFGSSPEIGAGGAAALVLGLPTAWLAVGVGTRPFGPMLAASFATLGLLAVRNMSLFGIVGAAVLAAELGEWSATLRPCNDATSRWGGFAARSAVFIVVAVLCATLVTGSFFARAEDCHRFGLRERPFYYAHDACRFAGRPGMPQRALVFGLLQAGVYEFHNGPARRVAIDGRLEVASPSVFGSYVRLHRRLTEGDGRWEDSIAPPGQRPLILVDHSDNAPAVATLLADRRWRCVYIDAVAAIFLPRDRNGSLERDSPTIDFAARHFRRSSGAPGSLGPASAYAEALALERVAAILAHRPAPRWSLRVPMNLVALDLARSAIAESAKAPGTWVALGHAALSLAGDPGPVAGNTGSGWDLAADLPWAQARSAYREALALDPTDASTLRTLAASFALRGADQAFEQGVAVERWRGQGRPLPWADAERVAGALLHLGLPREARRIWLEAGACPSESIRAARVADADLVAWAFVAADAGYRRALDLDPGLADAWLGLAISALEQGHAAAAVEAARAVLNSSAEVEPRRRALLEEIETLCAPYAQ